MAEALSLVHSRYQAGELLGRGAQGFVLRVTDREAPSRALAAKVWRAGAFSAQLLAGEFALLARLRAPGLVRAHDFSRDQASGAPFLVEDFVAGPDAREWMAMSAPAERSKRLSRLLGGVARTLAALHDAGFVHGDLKPAHVRMRADEQPMLLDLGAAVWRSRRSSNEGPQALTVGYAAPELTAGARATPESDLYALGALGWTLATGAAPERERAPLRRGAAWVLPSLADLIERLLSAHPQDRPRGARAVLGALGAIESDSGSTLPAHRRSKERIEAATTLRGRELAQLMRPRAGVRYVSGAPGMGKSVLVRELVSDALLSGRDARLLRFPSDDTELVLRLIAYFRGANDALPFHALAPGPLLVALDDLERAPEELRAALDSFRCRPGITLDVVAAIRSAPAGADAIELDRLGEAELSGLCHELGTDDPTRVREIVRASDGNPGWLAAALGQIPLTRESALARARQLSEKGRLLLALFAVIGGDVPDELCRALVGADAATALAELSVEGLLNRRGGSAAREAVYTLAEPVLAAALADALAGVDVVDRIAGALLEQTAPRAAMLVAAAGAPHSPSRRTELLERACERAEIEGLRDVQTDALLALAADPKQRSAELLIALDRVTRGGGSAGMHPEVVGWLEALAEREPSVRVLALRRRAEQSARAGQIEQATELAGRALEVAERNGDPAAVALAHSTRGSVALYSAEWAAADSELGEAHGMFASGAVDDAEEIARLDHNRGVVALYRGRLDEARRSFEQSLTRKRALGDRGGVWACLLNLGLALTKLGRFDEADGALGEALALTRALGQRAGTGWCLAALADAALGRGDARGAERWVAEAEHLGEALPAAVRADLAILRAQVALLEGDGSAALAALTELPKDARDSDALVDARALIIEARASLVRLPANRRAAARSAIRGVRRARSAGLPEPEREALAVLAAARQRPSSLREAPIDAPARYAEAVDARAPDPLWPLVERLAGGVELGEAGLELARIVLAETGAERAFIALVSAAGSVSVAWGVDLDGLPIADAAQRLPAQALAGALEVDRPLYQPAIETRAGKGSRLIAAARAENGGSGVVVVEHRFITARFDAVTAEALRRWATLAALFGRLSAPPATLVAPLAAQASAPRELSVAPIERAAEPTTAFPVHARRRSFAALVGSSPVLERALARLDAAIDSDLPVLIVGDTGVGKELFARALHEHGARARGPFVAVSCGAIPESLFEAELFGHVRGSFTGAERARPGLLARAEGGTLLLDEVGELPLLRQAALLRALATMSYRPVGSDEERRFDVRVVAATNRDLDRAVAEGGFRQDLLYRLNVLEIEVPSLCDRAGDVALLARRFLEQAGSSAEIAASALALLESYEWPGNVRELEHQMQRLASLRLARIESHHLSREVREGAKRARAVLSRRAPPVLRVARSEDQEREQVRRALERWGGNITRAAQELGVTRQGLKKRMVRLGMRAGHDDGLVGDRSPSARLADGVREVGPGAKDREG